MNTNNVHRRHAAPSLPAYPIIVIGASTGGPKVIEEIIKELDSMNEDICAAILLVQHMPGTFTERMSNRLNRTYKNIDIQEADEGTPIAKGSILIAPGDYHLNIIKNRTGEPIAHLTDQDIGHGLSPSIDISMETAAEFFGQRALGILLSGMGQDGARGMQMIRAKGGETIVQDPTTCVVDSMVQYAMGCDGAGMILKPERIPSYIRTISSSCQL